MKKFLIILLLFVGIKTELIQSQIILSNGTGGGLWNSSTTWNGGVVPNVGNDVVVLGTDSVMASSDAGCNNLTVESGAKFASTGTGEESMTVQGRLSVNADAWFYNQAESPTLPGSIIELDPASTVVHALSGTIGGENNFEYGNLILRRNAGTTAAADLIINGDLILENNSNGNGFRLVTDDGGVRTGTVRGDVIINTGLFVCVDYGTAESVGTWNIEGDVFVNTPNSRMGPFSSANAVGLAVFNINGSIIVNGGRFQVASSSTHGTGTAIINLGGNLILNEGSQVRTNHDGIFALNFVGTGVQTVRLRGEDDFSVGNDANPIIFNDTIKAGSNVIFDLDTLEWRTLSARGGNFVVEGSLEMVGDSKITGNQSFTLNSGATLKIGSPDGLSLSDPIGNIRVTGTRTYSEDANFEYRDAYIQVTGDGVPLTVNGLTINKPFGVVFLSSNYTVKSYLNIINGILELNGKTITLGENAILTESVAILGTSGKITITKNIGIPSSLNVGGLGAVLTTSNDLGITTVERFHSAAAGNGNLGILRKYNIIPGQNNSGLNATIRLYYYWGELTNGLTEEGLKIFKSPDGSDNSWTHLGGTVDMTNDYVELSGINDFAYFTLADINSTLPVEEDDSKVPEKFTLYQNYPNPFNPETVIKFEIPEASFVNLTVYNSLGEKIETLVNKQMNSGFYKMTFDAKNLPSGIYIYRLLANEKIFTQKMLMVK